jgi:multisubunit Na+/H+ antiporter MnhF subunit
MTRRINLALVVIATICVAIRFIARWRIQDSNIGWDDWTILASYVLIIPSTVILQISSFPVSALALLCGLC